MLNITQARFTLKHLKGCDSSNNQFVQNPLIWKQFQ